MIQGGTNFWDFYGKIVPHQVLCPGLDQIHGAEKLIILGLPPELEGKVKRRSVRCICLEADDCATLRNWLLWSPRSFLVRFSIIFVPCFVEDLNSVRVPHAESLYSSVQSFLHGDSSDVAIRLNDFNCLQLVALVKRGFKEWGLYFVGKY